jgi:hypothetical protein
LIDKRKGRFQPPDVALDNRTLDPSVQPTIARPAETKAEIGVAATA